MMEISKLLKRDDNNGNCEDDDDGASSDQDDHTFDCIPRSNISYTTKEIPAQRRCRNILTQQSRAIATPQTEIEILRLKNEDLSIAH